MRSLLLQSKKWLGSSSFGDTSAEAQAAPSQPIRQADTVRAVDQVTAMAYPQHNIVALFEVGDLDQIQRVLGEVDDPVYKDGKRPLHLAAIYGHTDIAQWLVSEGASVEALDQGAHTPLHLAAKYGHTAIMNLLIQHGADVNATNKLYKLTPMHMAAKEGQREAAEALIRAGADVDACAKDGVQPLHTCAEKGHRDVAAVLIQAGASPNVKDSIGWTPLHLSIEHKQDGMVALLLKLHADPDTPNKNGWTPLHLAAYNGSAAAVRTLLEYGANVDAVNSAGKTPLNLAVEQQHATVVPMLNAQAAAQLTCQSLVTQGTADITDGGLASAPTYTGDDVRDINALLGGLGLNNSSGARCPFCNIHPMASGDGTDLADRTSTGGSTSGMPARTYSSTSSTGGSASTAGVPSLFICPLSQRVLKDPVVACDGFTYDRRSIQEFFESGQRISPLTKQPLRSTATLPNHVVRCAVNEWLEWNEKRLAQVQR